MLTDDLPARPAFGATDLDLPNGHDETMTETAAAIQSVLDASDARALLKVMADAVLVRRRYEFFVWAQVRLQTVLPHDVLVCGVPRSQSARMFYDYYYSTPIDPEALARLCHPRDGLANDLMDRWIGDGYEPLLISKNADDSADTRLGEELAAIGFGDCVVHGIPKAQTAASAHCFFAFVSLQRMPGERDRQLAQMLVPHVFSAYSRAQTRERPAAVVEPSGEREAGVTDREVEILRWIREGKSNLEIGMILSISPLTVKNHVQKILRKLNASNRAQAVSKAISIKLLGASSMRRAAVAEANGEAGFTLLELLVVMVIIGLLAGLVGPKFFAQIGKSETQVARAQIDSLEKALDQYRIDTGHYPNASQGLTALMVKPEDEPRWAGAYLKREVPQDPWGRAYVYRTPGAKGEFDLLTLGRDGQPGGSGDDQDVGIER
jgi:general secretion pathway protein G